MIGSTFEWIYQHLFVVVLSQLISDGCYHGYHLSPQQAAPVGTNITGLTLQSLSPASQWKNFRSCVRVKPQRNRKTARAPWMVSN